MHAATQQAAEWWARPRGETAGAWITNYQQSLQTRHRGVISQIVGEIQPATLLEVGCHCGPNLIRLATDHPRLTLSGIDISPEAIAAGQRWASQLPSLSARIEMAVGQFPAATETFPDGAFDVVLSCYALAYIAPVDLDAVLYELGRLATRAVIIAEPQVFDASANVKQTITRYTEWQHNYQEARAWATTLRTRTSRIVAVEPPVDALSAILVLES
jgi:ubiquinone/menaquinone biosynthesis C-methylase UbiE